MSKIQLTLSEVLFIHQNSLFWDLSTSWTMKYEVNFCSCTIIVCRGRRGLFEPLHPGFCHFYWYGARHKQKAWSESSSLQYYNTIFTEMILYFIVAREPLISHFLFLLLQMQVPSRKLLCSTTRPSRRQP